MKKTYIQPCTMLTEVSLQAQLMEGSIQATISDEEYDGAAGSRIIWPNVPSIWDDDDEE